MEARRLLDSAAFGPDALKTICQAFDEAWAEIEASIGCDQQREMVRLRLADAILSVASESSRDAEVLKKAALDVLAGDFRWHSMVGPVKQ
jgi:hypothetical protein